MCHTINAMAPFLAPILVTRSIRAWVCCFLRLQGQWVKSKTKSIVSAIMFTIAGGAMVSSFAKQASQIINQLLSDGR